MYLRTGICILLLTYFAAGSSSPTSESFQWTAKWISPPEELKKESFKNLLEKDKEVVKSKPGLKPVYYFRKTFTNLDPVEEAFIYCTSKGLYKGYLTDPYGFYDKGIFPLLDPAWTNYNKTIQYHTYDVTYVINSYTSHIIGVAVAAGWYSGYISPENYNIYGDSQSFLLELHIKYKNGSKTIIGTDETWKVTTGQVVYSDLVHGELFYQNRTFGDWLAFDYDDSAWFKSLSSPVEKHIEFASEVNLPYVKKLPIEFAEDYLSIEPEVFVYRFRKLITGTIDFNFKYLTEDIRVKVRYGEAMYPNGSIYTGSHRSDLDTDVFWLNDPEHREGGLSPSFNYHSFQYVEITGLGYPLNIQNELHAVGYIPEYHRAKVAFGNNFFLNNIITMVQNSHYSNLLVIPTNSRSRDTKLGWLEPAGLYSLTGMYVSAVPNSWRKFLKDMREAQAPSGAFSNVAPKAVDESDASPGSGTAPLIITYNLYRMFGEIEDIKENYESNKKWLKYVISSNPNYLFINSTGKNVGDIGNVNEETPKEIIATGYFAYGALLMSYMAKTLNKKADQEYYSQLHKNISNAFVEAYVNEKNGKVKGDTQTGYVISLAFKILPEELVPKAVNNLVENIKIHDYHLTTGYVGTAFLLPVLSDNGHSEIAYKLLFQDTFPSWGYMLRNGATTIWEHWDSWTEEKGFHNSSFNSLALGSVGNWLCQYVVGVNTDEEEVGFKKLIIKPYIGDGLDTAFLTFFSKYGYTQIEWINLGDSFYIQIYLPENTKGKLILPFKKEKWEKELDAGHYNFTVPFDL